MSNPSDKLFADSKAPYPFEFNSSVAEVFDDMISRSVPGYLAVQEMVGDLIKELCPHASLFYDLGCSTGALTFALANRFDSSRISFVGIDNATPMIDKAQAKLAQRHFDCSIEFSCDDVLLYRYQEADVFLVNYVLQFLKTEHRLEFLQTIYQKLKPGGLLIVSEKTAPDSEPLSEAFRKIYENFKFRQNYSRLEIANKRKALENVWFRSASRVTKIYCVRLGLMRLKRFINGFRSPLLWLLKMTLRPVQIKRLRSLLQVGTEEAIVKALEKFHPSDISILFSELEGDQIQKLVDCLLLVQKAGVALKEIPEFLLPDILEAIETDKLSLIVDRLDLDDSNYLLSKVPESRWPGILKNVSAKSRLQLERLLLYPKDSSGSVMNPAYFSIAVSSSVEETLQRLQKFPDRESVFYIYVVDDKKLVGVIPLRNLVIADPETPVRKLMKTKVIQVNANDDQEQAAQLVSQYNLLGIPVVNDNQELLGVITVDDVIDIFEEEATEDIYNMAGLSGEDRAFTSVLIKVKKRLPWLLINLCTAFLAASVVGFFESTIEKVAILAAYMPVVAGLGGNGGTQSMVVITRSIALGEMEFSKATQAVTKEVLNGLILGMTAGLLSALVAYMVNSSPFLGLILFLAMTINMFFAGFMGSSVPLVLKALKLDPAVGASVFVTATTDISGFFVFWAWQRR